MSFFKLYVALLSPLAASAASQATINARGDVIPLIIPAMEGPPQVSLTPAA